MRWSRVLIPVVLAFVATAAMASWYDDYNDGLTAVRGGNWDVAAKKMSAAIAAKPKENNKERAYGTIFINYHPYYYRGVANLNLGRYEQAISDLETATGPGPENLGSIDMLLQMAKTRLQSGQTQPVPVPAPQPVTPAPVPVPVPVPVGPTIDPALRSRAQAAVNEARGRLQAAQQRNAGGTPQYQSALQHVTDANSKLAAARSNDDLQAVIAAAENATLMADSAVAPVTTTIATTTGTTRPESATNTVLADSERRVRRALESYFRGDFDEAARDFQTLASEMPRNGWIWAFLGASQYSLYAFEADEQYKTAALAAFKKAKQYRKWGKDGLPSKYFSRRIRRAFSETAG